MAVTVWLSVFLFPKKEFRVIVCDVGQGDAILITYGPTQILSDGGPNSSVLNCLSENMAFWDRRIELVIMSHPQLDHFGGLVDVTKRYKIDTFMTTGLDSGSQEYGVLKSLVGGGDTKVVKVSGGQKYRLGLIHLDILWPTEGFVLANSAVNDNSQGNVLGAFTATKDANEFSLVSMVSFEDFDILLTGDISPDVSDILAEKLGYGRYDDIEILKVPHHGSKNGLTEKLLQVVHPETAIISVGKNNRYGHPHDEVIELLREKEIEILRTDQMGNIEIQIED